MNQIKTSEIYNAVDNDNYRIIRDEVPYSIGDVSNIILDANQVRDLLRDNRNSEFDTNNSLQVAEHLRDSWKLTTKNTSQTSEYTIPLNNGTIIVKSLMMKQFFLEIELKKINFLNLEFL